MTITGGLDLIRPITEGRVLIKSRMQPAPHPVSRPWSRPGGRPKPATRLGWLVCEDHCRYRCRSVPMRERPRALRASISFGKKLRSRVAPSYYLESLLCNAPTEAFSNKRSRACRRMYVRWCIPRGLFGKGCSRSGLPPSRILMFRERLMNRLCGLSWLARLIVTVPAGEQIARRVEDGDAPAAVLPV